MRWRRIGVAGGLLAATVLAAPAAAMELKFGLLAGSLDTNVTVGAAMRMEARADDLIGKSNLDPELCGVENGVSYQSCQAVFRDQIYPAQRLIDAPGAATMRADDGDLNYDQCDLTQAISKITQDPALHWGDVGFFARWMYFRHRPRWRALQSAPGQPRRSGRRVLLGLSHRRDHQVRERADEHSVQPSLLFGHDVEGTAPAPPEDFIEDRKQAQVVVETRYRDALTRGLGYSWYRAGAAADLYRDRDFLQAFLRYQF